MSEHVLGGGRGYILLADAFPDGYTCLFLSQCLNPAFLLFEKGLNTKVQEILAQQTVQSINLSAHTINNATFLFMKACGAVTHHKTCERTGNQLQIKTLKFRCLHICWVSKTLCVANGDSSQYCQWCQE